LERRKPSHFLEANFRLSRRIGDFLGAPFQPGKYATTARVVDMAPTLVDILGIRPLEKLDGIVLQQARRR